MTAKVSAAVAAALVLAACGGEREAEQPAPKLPPALAERLAAEADAVAGQLDAGDPCGAAERAVALQQATIQALNRPGAVPDELKEDIGVGVADLVDRAQTDCAAAQPPPATIEEEEDDDENGEGRGKRGKGKGKGKGRGKKDD